MALNSNLMHGQQQSLYLMGKVDPGVGVDAIDYQDKSNPAIFQAIIRIKLTELLLSLLRLAFK